MAKSRPCEPRGQAGNATPGAARMIAALEDARRAGLLDDSRRVKLSFRAPKALLDAAKRESGIESPTELGILALAVLARTDAAAAFLARSHGKLGKVHKLEF